MIIEVSEEILEDFMKHHSLEAVYRDRNYNEVKRAIVSDFTSTLFLDSFTTPTYKGNNRTLAFRRQNMTIRIEKLGVVTMDYIEV